MRPLQQFETATLSMLKGKNSKKGAYTKDASEVLIAILIVIEEVGHSLGINLWVRDEASPGVINTFAAEQRAGEEAVEDLNKDIIHKAGQCVPLIRGLLHFIMCMQ